MPKPYTDLERLRHDNQALKEAEAKSFQRVRQLERELKDIQREKDSAENIRETIYSLSAQTPEPPKWIDSKHSTIGHPGIPVEIWSDWHWGEVVNPTEVGGVNTFNRTIAKRRLQTLIDNTIDLTFNHMTKPKYPGIVICLAGDFFTGTIHDELRETNEGFVFQILSELQDQMAMAITQMADKFGRVFLPAVVGNHGRTSLRPRAKGRVYENYEWNLYCQLERYFRSDDRVQFFIPGETDAFFTVLGHRFLLSHGDVMGVRGGDGIIAALGPIARGAIKVGRSEAQIGRDFDTLLIGHYHTYMPRGDTSAAMVNGSLVGYNEHARLMLRVPYARPSQALFFVHARHGITFQIPVYLEDIPRKHPAKEWVSWRT
jgi:hypothetical protein